MIIHEIEQGTPEWHKIRAGIPTGSEAAKLVTSTGQVSKSMPEYAMTLAAERYAGKVIESWGGNKYTDRGKELEPLARADYEMLHQLEVRQVGFVTNDEATYGCSPDGLVGDDGMVEYKCQIAKEHIASLLYYQKMKKAPTAYVSQCQFQMYTLNRDWCDLVFYHPDLPGFTIRQRPDPVFVATLERQLIAVETEINIILKALRAA